MKFLWDLPKQDLPTSEMPWIHYNRVLVQYSDCIQNRTIAVGIQSWHNYCRNTVRNFLCRRNTVAIQSHCVRVWGFGYEISLFLCPYEILVTSKNYCSRNTVVVQVDMSILLYPNDHVSGVFEICDVIIIILVAFNCSLEVQQQLVAASCNIPT